MPNHQYNKKLSSLASNLRNEMTRAECCLWKYALRAGMMRGYPFRRQRPIGPYITDFVCLELRLVIEVDGESHLFEETQVKDMAKDKTLNELGFVVLRFTDEEVLGDINGVKLNIERCIDSLKENILPLPPPKGETMRNI